MTKPDEAFIVAYDFHSFRDESIPMGPDYDWLTQMVDYEVVHTMYLMDKGYSTNNKLMAKPRETLGNAKKSISTHLKGRGRTDPGPLPQLSAYDKHPNQRRHWIDNIRILRIVDHLVADVTVV